LTGNANALDTSAYVAQEKIYQDDKRGNKWFQMEMENALSNGGEDDAME